MDCDQTSTNFLVKLGEHVVFGLTTPGERGANKPIYELPQAGRYLSGLILVQNVATEHPLWKVQVPEKAKGNEFSSIKY